jgi:hypothetical protein
VQRVERLQLSEAVEASPTRRGAGGFGSTGVAPRASKRKRPAPRATKS